jgi:hypothetical protein
MVSRGGEGVATRIRAPPNKFRRWAARSNGRRFEPSYVGASASASGADFALAAGGNACRPAILGIGAAPPHHEHRSPSTRLPTEANGWRSTVRMSIARLVRQPGQYTSSHGVPAVTAARIVGDHSAPRPAASAAFQRSMTASASARAVSASPSVRHLASISGRRVRCPICPQASWRR